MRQRAENFREYQDSLHEWPVQLPREYECRPFGWVVVKMYWGTYVEAQQARPAIPRWRDKSLDSYLPNS